MQSCLIARGCESPSDASSDNATVTWNQSFRNDKPADPRGGSTGILIGDSRAHDSLVTNSIVDFNVVYDNEDSGIEVKGASRIALRRNISCRNLDHGFDNNKVKQIRWINNIAHGNQHDGFSVEDTSHYVEAYNNIFAYNAVTGSNLGPQGTSLGPVREMFVDSITNGFISDHNLIYGRTPGTYGTAPNTWNRYLTDFPSGNASTLAEHKLENFPNDANSFTGVPGFADTTGGFVDFSIAALTDSVVDRGKTDMTGWFSPMWLSSDPRGFVAYDAPRTDGGAGSVTFSDIGAYEVDPAPGAPTIGVGAGRYDVVVTWYERGNDADDNTALTHEVYLDGTGQGASSALAPGTPVCFHRDGLSDCTPLEIKVKITDLNQVVWSNVVNTSTDCSGTQAYYCDEQGMMAGGGGEESSMASLEELGVQQGVDYPLSLSVLGPNPARSLDGVVFAIPKAMNGSPYELSLFDVSGRRVMTAGSGAARAGWWLQPLPVAGDHSRDLSAGVYFLRLVVANRTLTRTVILVP
jgi:hypothetical protein